MAEKNNTERMMTMAGGVPRRINVDLNTSAELAIREAVRVVENAGAHPLLTDAVVLLAQGREKVADWVDQQPAVKVSDWCEYRYSGEDGRCTNLATVGYPAMGGGFVMLCDSHGEKHAAYTQPITDIRAGVRHPGDRASGDGASRLNG